VSNGPQDTALRKSAGPSCIATMNVGDERREAADDAAELPELLESAAAAGRGEAGECPMGLARRS